MTIVAEMFVDQVDASDFVTPPSRQAFTDAVTTVADRAKAALPASHAQIDHAMALVLAGAVEVLPDGTARVASQDNGTMGYRIVNGHCDCTLRKQHDTK
jgi:hypothetical protein